MKTKILLLALSLGLTTFAQVVPNIDFITIPPTGGEREMIDNVPSALDITNNAEYISGYSRNTLTFRDYLLIKYDLNGNIVWQKTYDYAGLNDRALAIAVDNTGNIYITGEATSPTNGTDIITRKYDLNGNLIWSTIPFNGTANGDDKGLGIVVDNSGNVFVCGYTSNTGTGKDFTVIRYNSSGVQSNIHIKNGTASGDDAANAIAFFGNRLYVTGYLKNTGTNNDIFTTRLNSNNLFVNWTIPENGTANLNDQGLDIKIQGNDVLVCGGIVNTGTNQDYFFAKYNATNGINVFSPKTYDAFGGNDFATSLVLDGSNTYAITGMAQNGSNSDYHTVKYTNSGVFSWVNKHLTNTNFANVFPKIAVDNIANHFYVSGVTFRNSIDAAVYQITPGGNESWSDYYDGFGMRDGHVDLSVDNFGRIYLATLTEKATNIFDIALIRYSQTPVFFPPDPGSESPSMAIQFYKNTNLVLNTAGNFESSVNYFTMNHNTYDFIRKDGISHVFARLDSTSNDQDSLEKIDINFTFPNELTKQYDFEPHSEFTNFYYSHTAPNGVSIRGAKRIMEPNLWSGVDLHYYTNNAGLKYYFVVKPGTSPSAIQMNIANASVSVDGSGRLKLNNPFGEVSYDRPIVYQVGTLGNIIPITTFTPSYVISGNDVSFSIGTYNTALPLVIMMRNAPSAPSPLAIQNLNWSTFYGGNSEDIFYDVKSNASNSVWVTGRTASINFPVGSAHQGTNGGSFDAVFLKFNTLGVRQWATYIGGSLDDTDQHIHGIEVDPSGNCYSAFGTLSTNFPLLNPGGGAFFDNTNNTSLPFAPKDLAIVSFNNSGVLIWSTYFGGDPITSTSFDVGLDKNNNFVLTGLEGGFPIVTPSGAYNSPFAAGTSGAYFVAKFNASRQIVWSTHFGVNGVHIKRVAFNSTNDLFIAGDVNQGSGPSYDFKNPGGGAHFVTTAQGGAFDGHIARFGGTSSNLVWSTLYGGSNNDKIHGLTIDGSDNIYISGESESNSGLITGNTLGMNNTSYSGNGSILMEPNGDAFLTKFRSGGQFQSDTYFGGTSNDGSFNIFSKGNSLFVNFQTGSNDMPFFASNPTNAFVQAVNNDGHNVAGDGYFTVMDNNFNFQWSSYFGGNSSLSQQGDAIYSNTSTNDSKFYIVGYSTATANFPLVNPGAGAYYQPTKASGVDAFIAQFDLSALAIGINELLKTGDNNSIVLYPNPAHDATLLTNSNSGIYNVDVIDVSGKLIKTLSATESKIKINTSDLAQGIYFVKVYNKEYSIVKKLVVN